MLDIFERLDFPLPVTIPAAFLLFDASVTAIDLFICQVRKYNNEGEDKKKKGRMSDASIELIMSTVLKPTRAHQARQA